MKEWILEEETECPQKVEPTPRKLRRAEGNAAEEMGVTLFITWNWCITRSTHRKGS